MIGGVPFTAFRAMRPTSRMRSGVASDDPPNLSTLHAAEPSELSRSFAGGGAVDIGP